MLVQLDWFICNLLVENGETPLTIYLRYGNGDTQAYWKVDLHEPAM